MTGPLALVGSGEYLPVMHGLESALLDDAVARGRSRRYVQIPTAASLEGDKRLHWWVELGRAQAERMDAEAVPIVAVDRDQADDPALAALVGDAGLVYLSGGNPAHLAATLRGTALWRAVVAAWQDGAALAGCSAGAMVMAAWVPEIRNPLGGGSEGLGLTPSMRVLPHFDRWMGRLPDAVVRPMAHSSDDVALVGVDEDTALVHGLGQPDGTWQVHGRQSAWLLQKAGRQRVATGETVRLPAPRTLA